MKKYKSRLLSVLLALVLVVSIGTPALAVVSDYDKEYLSDSQQNAIQDATDAWWDAYNSGDQAGMDAAHDAAEAERATADYSGGDDGSEYHPWGDDDSGGDDYYYYTPATYMPMWNYPDYFPEVDGGSPAGRAVEPHPFDASVLGEDLDLLRPSGMAAPVPMPITGADYRSINLITRTPKGLLTAAKRVGQGIGGKALKRHYMAGGQALGAALIAGLRTAGVDVWTRAPLTDLVVEEGRVTGVVVERAGAPVTVSATKGVILASGGFDHNLEMRRRYQSDALEEWSIGNPANTGEVLQIAERAGADLTLMDQAWWFPSMAPLPGAEPLTMLAERSLPHSMIVDGSGTRFFNEAVNYM
ncbi:MAG: FAD-binding protein, partial [Clostridia bacterium]|nr:FAD-binding protein [Clostridia bacterium]